jgi:hypothetical protein
LSFELDRHGESQARIVKQSQDLVGGHSSAIQRNRRPVVRLGQYFF